MSRKNLQHCVNELYQFFFLKIGARKRKEMEAIFSAAVVMTGGKASKAY